jgi:hypothetical protein
MYIVSRSSIESGVYRGGPIIREKAF